MERGRTNLGKIVPSLQIFLALILVIAVLVTPFASFRFYGYGAFALSNTSTDLVAAAVIITALGIAYAAYIYGWKSYGQKAARYARMTLLLGAFQWVWVLSLAGALWSDIIYNATFAINGYYWWLDAATYAVLLGAIVFTITGLVAIRMTKVRPPIARSETRQIVTKA